MAGNENNPSHPASGDSSHDIEAVSRRTGLPEATINDWESRFGPIGSDSGDGSGTKVYSEEAVNRLSALNSLVEEGHEIGEIGQLPLEELQAILGVFDSGNAETGTGGAPCKVIVVGAKMASLLNEPGGFGDHTDVVRFCADLGEWENAPEDEEADLILVDCPVLFNDTIDLIRKRISGSGALRAVVVYEFSKDATKAQMDDPAEKFTAMRAPVTVGELRSACEADLALASIRNSSLGGGEVSPPSPQLTSQPAAPDDTDEVSPRKFSDSQLSRISQISTAINCECPHHLAALLSSLNAFEQYSLECENRNAEDAALHAYLYRRTARARAIMEDALSVLAEAEGISID